MTRSPSEPIDPARLARLEEMLDRQDILDCFTRLTRGSDRADRELFLSAFHPDATVDVGELVAGPDALYDWAAGVQESGQASSHHHILNHTCEIEGDVAHAETYYFFLARNRDGTNGMIGGRYVCRLERRERAWKIAMHCNVVEWGGVLPTIDVPFAKVPGVRTNGPSSRGKDDISYRRPLVNKRPAALPGGFR